MPADNSAYLAAATQRRASAARARARTAIRRLDREGTPITYVAVATAGNVSRALLYRDRELHDEIERLRKATPTRMPRPPAAQQPSQDSRDQRLDNSRVEIAELREENQRLRAHLASFLGEQRVETYHSKATPTTTPTTT